MTDKEIKPATKAGKSASKKASDTKTKTSPSKTDKPNAVKPTPVQSKQDNLKPTNWIGLFVIVSIVNLSAVAYLWYSNQQKVEQTLAIEQQKEKQLDELENKIQQQQQVIENLNSHKHQDLDLIRQKIDNLGRLSLTMQSQLNLTQQQVNQAGKGVNQDLILNEADFLIRTAAIRLLLTENINETTNLLKAADKKLLKINDVAIFPVRAALTKDLYQLKATTQIDVIGTYLILENLEKSITALKINFILPQQTKQKESVKPTDEDWYQHLSNTTENVIDEWFQVTHYDEEIKPLVSKHQDMLIKQSIVLQIKQAQWALIKNNMELYQLTLKNLSEQIAKAFNKQDATVKAALVEIKTLLSESIVTPTSKYLNSEKAMKTYLEANTESNSQ